MVLDSCEDCNVTSDAISILRNYQALYYRGADKSLAQPTSRCILFDGQNISFAASLAMYINSTNIPPIMIISRIYEHRNLLSLQLVSFLVGLRTYQHPYILFDGQNISFDASLVIYINSTNIPPIVIINRIYEHQNLQSLQLVSFLVGLRTYQHPCILFDGQNISFDASLVIYINSTNIPPIMMNIKIFCRCSLFSSWWG